MLATGELIARRLLQKVKRALVRRAIDIALWVLSAISLALMLKASSDPSPQWLQGSWLQRSLAPFPTGNQVIFDLSVGLLVGLFVYVLVVRLPERRKRRRVKASLHRQYEFLKEACILQFLWACGGSADIDQIDRLKDQSTFRAFFKERVSPHQDRWQVVVGGLDDMKLNAIVNELMMFRRELEYALTAIDVDDPSAFDLLRHLTHVLHQHELTAKGGDGDMKSLARFLWSVHTGWEFAVGYTGRDYISDMINVM